MAIDRKKTKLFDGLNDDDILFDDDLDFLDEKEAIEEDTSVEDEEEYKRWLEEGIKQQKGYGTKESYQGEIPADDGQSYYNSYRYQDQVRSDATEEMIIRLKERDNKNALRDRLIAYSLPMGHKMVAPQYNFHYLINAIIFVFSYVIGISIAVLIHLDGMDRELCGGVAILIGGIIKNNGIGGYTLADSFSRSLFELAVLIYIAILWVCDLIGFTILLPVHVAFYIAFIFAAYFHFKGEYGIDKRMIFYKTLETSLFMLAVILTPITLTLLKNLLLGATE